MNSTAPYALFRQARERAGLTVEELAARCGIDGFHAIDIREIEGWPVEGLGEDNYWNDTDGYSPKCLQTCCHLMGIRLIDLFGTDITGSALSGNDLARLIHTECRLRGVTLNQFADQVLTCFNLEEFVNNPTGLENVLIRDLQRLGRELCIDWRRLIVNF